MVTETLPETALTTTPDPASTTVETLAPIEGQVEGGTGPEGEAQGQVEGEKPPAETPPAPTEQEQLDAALAVREAGERGDQARALTDHEKVLLRSHDDRAISLENAARGAVARQQEMARELANAHTTAQNDVVTVFNEALAEAGVGADDKPFLTASAAKLLDKTLQEKFRALEEKSAQVHLVPLLTYGADSLFDWQTNADVVKDLYPKATPTRVRQHLLTLPLVSGDGTPSLMSEAYRTGWAAAKKAGPTPDTVVLTKAELAAQIKAAKAEQERVIRGDGAAGTPGAGGAGGSGLALTLAQIDAMPMNEWLSKPKPERERLLEQAHQMATRRP